MAVRNHSIIQSKHCTIFQGEMPGNGPSKFLATFASTLTPPVPVFPMENVTS